jgi:hypothetical protein
VEKKTEEMERRERDSRMVEAAGTLFHYLKKIERDRGKING